MDSDVDYPPWVRRLPNQLSALRLALVPVIGLLTLEHVWQWSMVFFTLAAITDALDGTIARFCNARTALGERLDPLADKALVNVTALCLGASHVLPMWLVALVVLRDVLILGGALISRIRGYAHDLLPLMLGKISTSLQMLLLAACFAAQLHWLSAHLALPWLQSGVALFAIVSGAAYVRTWIQGVPPRATDITAQAPQHSSATARQDPGPLRS